MVRIKTTAFTGLKPNDFCSKCQEIKNLMVQHVSEFPSPPDLTTIQTALDVLSDLVIAAESGAHTDIIERNGAHDTLKAMMIQLASYVVYTVQNKANATELIELVGFVPARRGGRIGQVSPPESLDVMPVIGTSKVNLDWKAVYGANSYVIEMTPGFDTAESVWQQFGTSTRSRFEATGLTPGQFYSWRIKATGAAGVSSPSPVVTCVVG